MCFGPRACRVNIRFYANLFDDYYRVQYRPGRWAESETLCYSLRLNFWAKLWEKNGSSWFDGLQVFTIANYLSRTQTLLAEVDPYFSLDCGVSTDLFDRRLSLFLNVNDLFCTGGSGTSTVNAPTISGSTPSSSSALYSEPLTLTDTTTVKAIALKNGLNSSVATKVFTKGSGSGDAGGDEH